ncbi:hypothetical protein ACI8AC_06350 [Geodermatophilus sp. SYSU D00758]
MAAYGRAALEELREAVREAKSGDPLAPVTVLMPNNIAGIVARRFLAHGLGDGHRGVAALFPTTIVRLAEQLAAPALHPRRPATTPVVAAAWRAALKDPGIFEPVAEHAATVEALVRAGRELRDVDDQALDALTGATTLGPDLVRLYGDVRAALSPGWYDETDLLRTAAELCRRHPERTTEVGAVVLYLPQQLTRAEADLVHALAAGGQLRVVAGLTGHAKADAAVHRSLDRVGVEPPTPGASPTATQVLTASDADDEVRCVVREVVRSLAEHRPTGSPSSTPRRTPTPGCCTSTSPPPASRSTARAHARCTSAPSPAPSWSCSTSTRTRSPAETSSGCSPRRRCATGTASASPSPAGSASPARPESCRATTGTAGCSATSTTTATSSPAPQRTCTPASATG